MIQELSEAIRGRRRLIAEDAPCVGCGATLAYCQARQGTDPTAPSWFGCCARGTSLAPCAHQVDVRQQAALLDEIERGVVRSAEEIRAQRAAEEGRPRGICAMLDQDEWWRRKNGTWVRIADMAPSHRYNTAAMILRNAAPYGTIYAAGFAVVVDAHDGGEMAHEALEREADDLEFRISRDPAAWMRTTTLYRALTAGLAVDGDGTRPWHETANA